MPHSDEEPVKCTLYSEAAELTCGSWPHLGCLGILIVGGKGVPDIWWIEAQDEAKDPTMHRPAHNQC